MSAVAKISQTIQPARRFKMGATLLEDIDPKLTVAEVVKAYSRAYPHLASATIGEPKMEGAFLVYPLEKPAVTTKGARPKAIYTVSGKAPADLASQAAEALVKWEQEQAAAQHSAPAHLMSMHALAVQVLRRPNSPLDALLVPMA